MDTIGTIDVVITNTNIIALASFCIAITTSMTTVMTEMCLCDEIAHTYIVVMT